MEINEFESMMDYHYDNHNDEIGEEVIEKERGLLRSENSTTVVGRLMHRELKIAESGNKYADIIVGNFEYTNKNGENVYNSTFTRLFGDSAEKVMKLKEDTNVVLDGTYATESYEKDGEKHFKVKFNARSINNNQNLSHSNKSTISGILSKEPIIKTNQKGDEYAIVQVFDTFKSKAGETIYRNNSGFVQGKAVEVIKNLESGQQVKLQGKFITNKDNEPVFNINNAVPGYTQVERDAYFEKKKADHDKEM